MRYALATYSILGVSLLIAMLVGLVFDHGAGFTMIGWLLGGLGCFAEQVYYDSQKVHHNDGAADGR